MIYIQTRTFGLTEHIFLGAERVKLLGSVLRGSLST